MPRRSFADHIDRRFKYTEKVWKEWESTIASFGQYYNAFGHIVKLESLLSTEDCHNII